MTTFTAALTLAQALIRIPSPSGAEGPIVSYIQRVMHELGYDEVHVDELGSITASIYGNRPGLSLLLDSHIDTVEVANRGQWSVDPYGALIIDGSLYGRGAADMKGAAASMIASVARFKEIHGNDFAGSVHVSCTVCEECFEGYAAALVAAHTKADVVIIGEASELDLKRGQRGRAEIVLTTYGQSCHSSSPQRGSNAIVAMDKILGRILALPTPSCPILGAGILVPTDIISRPYPGRSVVPDRTTVTFDRRLLVGESRESVLQPIKAVIEEEGIEASVSFQESEMESYTKATIKAERFFDAWVLDDEAPLVQLGLDALHKQASERSSPTIASAPTPATTLGPWAYLPSALAPGPRRWPTPPMSESRSQTLSVRMTATSP